MDVVGTYPKWILVCTYDIPYDEYYVHTFFEKDEFKDYLNDLNVNLSNTGASWDSFIPLSYILRVISKITKILKIDDDSQSAYKMFNKGLDSFETVIRKQLVDYSKGDIYE